MESESGWKGDKRDGDWWERIERVEKQPGEAAHDVKVDLSHLASFPNTFKLEAERQAAVKREGEVLLKGGVQELVAAVQARAYRGRVVWHEEMPAVRVATIAGPEARDPRR